jgi:hypothetical protein
MDFGCPPGHNQDLFQLSSAVAGVFWERDVMRILRRLSSPVSESQLGWALGLALVFMAVMLLVLLWQSNIIVYQRDLIRELWNGRFAG